MSVAPGADAPGPGSSDRDGNGPGLAFWVAMCHFSGGTRLLHHPGEILLRKIGAQGCHAHGATVAHRSLPIEYCWRYCVPGLAFPEGLKDRMGSAAVAAHGIAQVPPAKCL